MVQTLEEVVEAETLARILVEEVGEVRSQSCLIKMDVEEEVFQVPF